MFIKLHTMAGEIRINMDLMESYVEITNDSFENAEEYLGLTYVTPDGLLDEAPGYIVKETPEEIDNLIYKELCSLINLST